MANNIPNYERAVLDAALDGSGLPTAHVRYQATRQGGQVTRCHTFPALNGAAYTNAAHSYNAVSLLLVLWPATYNGEEPPLRLVKALLWHDVGEGWMGDVPATAKWMDAEFCALYERLEARVLKVLDLLPELTPSEQAWLDAMDKLELLLWAREQQMMGNRYAESIREKLMEYFARMNGEGLIENFVWDYILFYAIPLHDDRIDQ